MIVALLLALAGGLEVALADGESTDQATRGSDTTPQDEVTSLRAEQKAEIRAELEAAVDARLAGRTGDMRERLGNARKLAEDAGHQGLIQRIHNCRSGLCLITVVQVPINAALKFLERIPTLETANSTPASAT